MTSAKVPSLEEEEMETEAYCASPPDSHLGPAAAQSCAWKNVLLAVGRSTRLLPWPEPGTSQHAQAVGSWVCCSETLWLFV
jgi:hypothetical protein